MIQIPTFISVFPLYFPEKEAHFPWQILPNLPQIILDLLPNLDEDFVINGGIAIHKTAKIEQNVTLKAPIIIHKNSFIGANSYLRGSVFLAESVIIGPGCEIKTSIIFEKTSIAHFNFVGDSILGSNVNMEAGAVIANHFNERENKRVFVFFEGKKIDTNCEKMGALIGDNTKIGANAVLTPGTILTPFSVVKRLELVDQEIIC